MKMYLTLILLIITSTAISCYREFHCPSNSEWKIRAKWYCNGTSTKYTCLYSVFSQKYGEACKYEPGVLDLGEEYIISHVPRGQKCKNENKYQPFKLSLNVSSECVLRKSACTEEGQVLFYNGSSKEDRTCRCDFTKNYAFLIRPQHPCKCIPGIEDCSCYFKKCSPNYKLTPEYLCIHEDNKTFLSLCPDILYSSRDTVLQYQLRTLEREAYNIDKPPCILAITMITICIGTLCLLVIIIMTTSFFETDKLPYIIKMRFEHNEEKVKELSAKVRELTEAIRNRFDNACKDIQGNQIMKEINKKIISFGYVLVDLTFTSDGFYDEQYLTETLRNAFKSITIDNREYVLEEFSLKGLYNINSQLIYRNQELQATEKLSEGIEYAEVESPTLQKPPTTQYHTPLELTRTQVLVSPRKRNVPVRVQPFFDCVILKDMTVLTSYSNSELLFHYTDGRDNRTIRLSGQPRCMSKINDDHIAVCYIKPVVLEYGKVGDIEIIDINKGIENIITNVWEVGCMTYQEGLLFVVIDGRKITAMNLSGIISRSFSCPAVDTSNISSNQTKLFLTAAATNILYCCDLFGSLLWKFKDDSLRMPSSITVDPNHNVYVTGDSSKNVLIVSADGEYHNKIILKDYQITFPIIICYDTKRNHLLAYNCVIGEAFLFDVKPSFTETCDVNLVKSIKLL